MKFKKTIPLLFALCSMQMAFAEPVLRLRPSDAGTNSLGSDPQNNIGAVVTNPTTTAGVSSQRQPPVEPKNTADEGQGEYPQPGRLTAWEKEAIQ